MFYASRTGALLRGRHVTIDRAIDRSPSSGGLGFRVKQGFAERFSSGGSPTRVGVRFGVGLRIVGVRAARRDQSRRRSLVVAGVVFAGRGVLSHAAEREGVPGTLRGHAQGARHTRVRSLGARRLARHAHVFQLAVFTPTALRAAAFQLAMRTGVAVRAPEFQLAMLAGVAGRALAFQLAMRAGVAVRAPGFQLAMRARVAVLAAVFPLAMRAGTAVRTAVFQLAMRAGVAVAAAVFLPAVPTPFFIPQRSRSSASRRMRARRVAPSLPSTRSRLSSSPVPSVRLKIRRGTLNRDFSG